MLFSLRIIFGAGFWYGIHLATENARLNPQTGDLANAFYLALCVVLGICNALVWAPVLGTALSNPITEVLTKSTYIDRKNNVLRLIYWLESHRCRRLTLLFCFLEGIRRPWMPGQFVIGLRNAKPGSWLEKVFAQAVFKFDNVQHCVVAYDALKRQGIDPGAHSKSEINLVLFSLEKSVKADPEKLPVPSAPPITHLKRNPRIQLFEMDPSVDEEIKADENNVTNSNSAIENRDDPETTKQNPPANTNEPAPGDYLMLCFTPSEK